MHTITNGKEQTILDMSKELIESSCELTCLIGQIVHRNPDSETGDKPSKPQDDNVLDEILGNLRQVRGRVRIAREEIGMGISQKLF